MHANKGPTVMVIELKSWLLLLFKNNINNKIVGVRMAVTVGLVMLAEYLWNNILLYINLF